MLPASAAADDWLPHDTNATWEYTWTDTAYNTTPTKEKVTVKSTKGGAYTLAWTTDGENNPEDAPASLGSVSFQEQPFGLVVTDWSSNPPPPAFPILCASIGSCGNSLASSLYNLIWGSRAPLLAEPLLAGTTWTSTGGAANDVTSTSQYLGTEQVSVPAFPGPVTAAKVRTQVTQAGALGDPYGSGVRTVWWVFGVGPVKVVFQHSGGTGAPVTTVDLAATNEQPKTAPPDANYFPYKQGLSGTYSWTNKRWLKKPEVEHFTIDAVANGTARFSFKSVSGPIKLAAAYVFTTRTNGVTEVSAAAKAASLAKLPPLGPKFQPADKRRHFFTPFDLMTFGFNPLMPAYPAAGNLWGSDPNGPDWVNFGVTGKSTVVGVQRVTVPAGTFRALVVRSSLTQAGFPFGSGTRTSWFAPDRGLVKLVFQHADKSVSRVVLVR